MNENNKKTYTSAEMREAADTFWVGGVICEVKNAEGRVLRHIKADEIIAMLRQAADDKTELSNLKRNGKCNLNCPACSVTDECIRLRKDKKQLAALFEAVVKECESQMPNCRLEEGKCNPNDGGYCEHCDELKVRNALMAVLKVAKGEES